MPEDNQPATPTVAKDGGSTTTPPAPTGGEQKPAEPVKSDFDPAKISDADFAKVFSDKRLFEHSRFKDLTAKAAEADALKAEKAKAQEEKLKEQGKYKELLEAKEAEAATLKETVKNTRIDNSLISASTKLGVIDPEVALKLIDRSKIAIDETTGAVTGAEEALKALLEAKPYLAGKPGQPKVGSASNPSADNPDGVRRFKHSEISDPVFYREHEAEILKAYKLGLIEQDK